MKFKEIEINREGSVNALLMKAEQREGKGGTYCVLTLTDGGPQVRANIWQTTLEQVEPLIGTVISGNVKVGDYNGRSYTIADIKATEEDYSEYIPTTPKPAETYFNYIVKTVDRRSSKDLAAIVNKIYEDNKETLLKAAAAKSMHHNIKGGLLMHTAAIVCNADQLKGYKINKGLLIAAAALHDIGKIIELDTSNFGDASYTLDGNLLNHTVLGIRIVDDAARELGLEETEEIKLLKHCIAAHHGKFEWGAIATAIIPEARMLFLLDYMDSQMYMYDKAISELKPGELSDKAVFGLDTRVYRPREED